MMSSASKLLFEGLHGTNMSSAAKIIKEGFVPKDGRAGTGVYLWRSCALAKELAKGWHSQKLAGGHYGNTDDQSCAVIRVFVEVEEAEFLDLEDFIFKEMLQDLSLSQGLGKNATETDAAALVSLLVSHYEKQAEAKVRVLQTRVSAPKPRHLKVYSPLLFGAPICLVVRDNMCISKRALEATDA